MDDSTTYFEIYEDGVDQWRLVHQNGNIIADSGEGDASKQKAEQGVRRVKQNVPDADIRNVYRSSCGKVFIRRA